MNAELEKLVRAERKNRIALTELRNIKQKLSAQTAPDAKLMKLVDDGIAELLKKG